jgi:mRNA interferase RelE/StbE
MASYRILHKPSVEKDLRALPTAIIGRIFHYIERLKDDPFPRRSIKLAGAEQLYRLRVGDYRIIYGVDKDVKLITVHYVRYRREAYRKL